MLSDGELVQHPFVTAELAMGNLNPWRHTIDLLDSLPQATLAPQAQVLAYVEDNGLMGTGIGFVDAQLLIDCSTGGHSLWTRDKRLVETAGQLELEVRDD